MASSKALSTLQRELLQAFFARTQDFFLTGGAALAEFYLHHRETEDLDLFTLPGVEISVGVQALIDATHSLGGSAKVLRESGDFKRYVVSRGTEMTLVDLVVDRAPQTAEKQSFGSVRVDAVSEIAANKLCALLDRIEVRDLIDLELLLQMGLSLEAVLEDAQKKHAGADPGTLAWVLSQFRIPPTAPIPGGRTREAVEAFRDGLIATLAKLALPAQ